MRDIITRSRRPDMEHVLRAVGYATIVAWAILFLIFPPTAFVSALDVLTRIFWMSITMLGATAAIVGVLTRIDIKLEFPGLLITQIGPLFYFASQVYYVMNPEGLDSPVTNRIALIVYAILPGILLLPRTYHLYADSRRLKKLNTEPIKNIPLSPEAAKQPGAFPTRRSKKAGDPR